MTIRRIISSSLSPNTQMEDVTEAIRVVLNPSLWQHGEGIRKVEEWFAQHFHADSAVSFDSGRSALLALLHAFDIGAGDDVLLQAFTCVAVPNSIRQAGATPVYVDIDDSFNIDPNDALQKITKKTKAVIVQHTFGVPAQMDEILKVARTYGIMVIEDCAHSLGATYLPAGKAGKGKLVGTLGDAAFFSFGRDKVISSVWGGIATMSTKYPSERLGTGAVQSTKLRRIQEALSYPSMAWIAQQLLHPIAFSLILPTYNVIVGKVILEGMKQMGLLSLPNPPSVPLRRYPHALARLLLKQIAKLERLNRRRRLVASYYRNALRSGTLHEGAIYLRYPIRVDDPVDLMQKAKRHGILLGNWYHHVVDPQGVDLSAVEYHARSCPHAEEEARHIINLPTLVTPEEARRVVSVL